MRVCVVCLIKLLSTMCNMFKHNRIVLWFSKWILVECGAPREHFQFRSLETYLQTEALRFACDFGLRTFSLVGFKLFLDWKIVF